MNKHIAILAFFGCLGATPLHAETIAITGGRVFTLGGQGVIENATVLIVDERIAAVGAGVPVPAGARRIDAAGRWVTPGIFDAASQLGLVEVPSVKGANDSQAAEAPFAAGFDVQYAVNPESTAIAVSRIEGLTRAAVFPASGKSIFAGYGAVIHLGTGYDLVSAPRAFAYLEMGETGASAAGGSRGAAWITLVEAFREAAGGGKGRGDDHANLLNRIDMEAIGPLIAGAAPLVIHVERAADILQALALKGRHPKLKLILIGAAEGWLVAERIAAAGVPVILDSFANLPGDFESLAATQENAARLDAAGVAIAIAPMSAVGGEAANARLVLQYAGNAVANGLPWEAALRAVTVNPARFYGLDKDLGTLEPGKLADVVVWDGDPLELSSAPTTVVIAGKDMPLVSRQTKLRDRYRDLGDPKPFAYRY